MKQISPSDIKIIFEDNHLLVVEKPVNVPSQEDDTGDPDMLTLLKQYIKEKYSKPGNVYLGLVHRLDRPVGGVMVFAKTSKSASRLSDQIRTRAFEKTYLAIVHGMPEKSEGTLVHYLLKDSAANTVSVVNEGDGGKEAVLDYNVMDENQGLALVHIRLHTGRSHQIRVQMAAEGHPLYGDQKYGARLNKAGWQIALWSAAISLDHPTTKERLLFKSMPAGIMPWTLFSGYEGILA